MPTDYLHDHRQFPALIRIVAEQKGIDPALVEKVRRVGKAAGRERVWRRAHYSP